MFKSTLRKGYQITFENGWTISVQWGYGNYCDNRSISQDGWNNTKDLESKTAEIAMWDKDDKWFGFGTDEVKGYCSANEVAEWIDKCSKF